MDSDGEEVEVGDLGLLEVRGANLFLGYWPDGADGPDPDGWFGTGDLAVADDDGDYYLVGRRSDLVLVNGFNVYPAEVEAVFSKLPGVAEIAVLGVSETEASDSIVAYVVPEPGTAAGPGRAAGAGRPVAGPVQAAQADHRGGRAAAHRDRQGDEVAAAGGGRSVRTGLSVASAARTASP